MTSIARKCDKKNVQGILGREIFFVKPDSPEIIRKMSKKKSNTVIGEKILLPFILCKDRFVGGWKIKVETDAKTEKSVLNFGGQDQMEFKLDQTFLGDFISSDGKQGRNILSRIDRGLGKMN
jgi:hypothetical protein